MPAHLIFLTSALCLLALAVPGASDALATRGQHRAVPRVVGCNPQCEGCRIAYPCQAGA
jgi:hypothetical protein